METEEAEGEDEDDEEVMYNSTYILINMLRRPWVKCRGGKMWNPADSCFEVGREIWQTETKAAHIE